MPRIWLRRLVPLVGAILLALAVSGCGHKGPLYLPADKPAAGTPAGGG
ncbi:LPS translocon maturation chaperone LptM [Acidihalobacter aeolianus]|nr:lipoprotein [Acidihalobacter aeolianus]